MGDLFPHGQPGSVVIHRADDFRGVRHLENGRPDKLAVHVLPL
jgi:hypothetical protein